SASAIPSRLPGRWPRYPPGRSATIPTTTGRPAAGAAGSDGRDDFLGRRVVRVLDELEEERPLLLLLQLGQLGVGAGAVLVLEHGHPLEPAVAHRPPGEHPRRDLDRLLADPRLGR